MTTTHAHIRAHYRRPPNTATDARLIHDMKKEHIKIEQVGNRRLKDYAGMNPQAAKALGFPHDKNTILIDKNLTPTQKHQTLIHELQEMKHMKHGDSYWTAHQKALREETK